jgi:hypothetical protein
LYGLDLEEPISFKPPRKVVHSCSPSTLPVLALPVQHAGVGAVKDDAPLASSAIPVLKEDIPLVSVPLENAALPAVPVGLQWIQALGLFPISCIRLIRCKQTGRKKVPPVSSSSGFLVRRLSSSLV